MSGFESPGIHDCSAEACSVTLDHMPISEARRAYLRKYQRRWIEARRQEWLNEHGPCQTCGTWSQLEVDHKDATTKRYNVTSLWSLALDNPKRVTELAKCWVLCHDCHLRKKRQCKEESPRIGSLNGSAVLNEKQVIAIRRRYAAGGITQQQLADEHGVDRTTIQYVTSRKNWKHL